MAIKKKPRPRQELLEKSAGGFAERPATGRWDRVRKYLEILADAGEVFMSIRDKPSLRDWLGVGLRVAALGDRVRGVVAEHRRKDPHTFFDSGRGWVTYGGTTARWVIENSTDPKIVMSHWDRQANTNRPVLASFGTVTVGWIGDGDWATEPVQAYAYMQAGDHDYVMHLLGEKLWAKLGSNHMAFEHFDPDRDDLDTTGFVVPEVFAELRERLPFFMKAGGSRGVLLNGLPGTGKSMGARYLAKELGHTSVRVTPKDLPRPGGDVVSVGAIKTPIAIESVLGIFRPDVLIIDDMDRVGPEEMTGLLSLLETALLHCRLVIMSINCPNKTLGAMLRPGRVDDIVQIGLPDAGMIKGLLDDHAHLAGEMTGLPVAYVADFMKRVRALGEAAALKELPRIREHAALVEQMTNRENDSEA